ncbi:unnamed protein product [Caenorhabditis angaria]|uniref:Uncharacterized protein n=1 Tax=Caenorhabditis angaria TaxID=860376 RepID=A0A9P1I8M2_9PELO|nr:unnamed protein product [Caenorhabditis angaria]
MKAQMTKLDLIDDINSKLDIIMSNQYQNVAISPSTPVQLDNALMLKHFDEFQSKKTRAVIERLADGKSGTEQQEDASFVNELCKEMNLDPPLKVYRHDCEAIIRPLKIDFGSQSLRDTFLKKYNKTIKEMESVKALKVKPRARRDLTKIELETLKKNRKMAYDENVKAGKLVYYIYDIEIRKNDDPRPFNFVPSHQ